MTSIENKIEQAIQFKEDGNKYFQIQEWKKALTNYHRVFLYINGLIAEGDELQQYSGKNNLVSAQQKEQIDNLKAATYGNMAQVYIYIKEFEKGRDVAKKSLDIKKNIKVLYRLAQCNIELNNLEEATQQLNEVQQIDKKIDITKDLANIQKKSKQSDLIMAQAMKKLFV